ncbi:hypothetical protein BU23DRAFT_247517 [Bimuria novae-zelandiae CBS 107.79]|uniref:MARVEL domain-containing protein n=1 Tax=Bimuria novae-zelandiae CBS 107.79 TaxID=1447943 RepID=A0A6A5UW35_9PLEO|nr:hypothetical protein BU23DRAFT_247517 [Bimuria novae-zelandiae CBS 107.79]
MASPNTYDYGTPAPARSKSIRPAILANHALHFISSLIVLGIAAYFISAFTHNTHLRYWVGLAAADVLFYIPTLFLPAIKSYKGYLAPLALIFSYLWLIAFVFSAQDYNYNGGQLYNSPRGANKPHLKYTLEAFAFIAFITSLVGFFLEARLWDVQRFKGRNNMHVDKHATAPAAETAPATV